MIKGCVINAQTVSSDVRRSWLLYTVDAATEDDSDHHESAPNWLLVGQRGSIITVYHRL